MQMIHGGLLSDVHPPEADRVVSVPGGLGVGSHE
jgi:hypothetical protein